MVYVLALLLGAVAGLRAMLIPAVLSWAARLGVIDVSGSGLAFLGSAWAPWLFTVLAVIELITDQLPSTPARTVPVQLTARLLAGALAGAAMGIDAGIGVVGPLIAGLVGAAIGTFGGRAARAELAARFGRDKPAALLEDAVAIVAALLLVAAVP